METNKRAATFGLILIASIGLILIGALAVHAVSSPILTENFANNTFDHSVWQEVQVGTGPNVIVANNQLEITIPGNSSNDPLLPIFGAALASRCVVSGDFDMQVGFHLLTWPAASGVRTGLGSSFLLGGTGPSATRTPFAVERDSFAITETPSGGEIYLTHLIDGVKGIQPTTSLEGTLRIARTGATATGYYLSGGAWSQIHSGPVETGDVGFGFGTWSHNSLFSHQNVKVAFTNFSLNTGDLRCPRISLSPPTGPIGTKVTVHGSGFPTQPNSPFVSIPTVSVSFDDNFIGTATQDAGSFDFVFNVPVAQVGYHQVKILDFLSDTKASADFQVTPTLSQVLSVALSVGTIYFPGDNAVIIAMTNVAGSPSSPEGMTIQMTLHAPDKIVNLDAQSISTGLFKASYPIPSHDSIGTYAIVVTVHSANNGNATSLAGFEVKQSWLTENGRTITVGSIASLGALGTVLVVWRKTKNKPSETFRQS